MGLLDQVLGQVIGSLGAGGASQPTPGGRPQAGGHPQGGGSGLPGGLNLPGGLGDLLAGDRGKIAMAILALLASRHLKSGAGGYGSILHDMFAGGSGGSAQAGGPDPRHSRYGGGEEAGGYGEPRADAPMPPQGNWGGGGSGSGSGGFLDQIGSLLDGPGAGRPSQPSGGLGGLGGALGGGMLGGGLSDLIDRFRQNGQGGAIDSWIGSGPNRHLASHELEGALGSDEIDELSRQTGLDREELLRELSGTLPQVVDGLTPHGRPPSEDETTHWV